MSFKEKQADLYQTAPVGALYVHVPFCAAKCRYCDFYSLAHDEALAGRYLQAALAELRLAGHCLHAPLRSIFVGGGTPSVLGPARLGELLAALQALADDHTEFSVEVNPGTLDAALAGVLADSGVTRINLGVQSLDDRELAVLGRIHTADQASQSVALLRETFGNKPLRLGLDLIYALPGQTLETWRASLEAALALEPQHLSCYALSYEAGTPLADDLHAGRLTEMDEDTQERCYRLAIEQATRSGLKHYEISNFAQPGFQCRHNLTYWHNLPYLGVGPSAASYVGGVRRTNTRDLGAWLAAIEAGHMPPCECESLTGRRLMAETLMLGLRLIEGVDRQAFADRFGADPLEAFPRTADKYLRLGALIVNPSNIRFSSQSLFVSDLILADLLAEA